MNDNPHQLLFCPSCGRPVDEDGDPKFLLNRFTGLMNKILRALIWARAECRAIQTRELVNEVYTDPRGGPYNAAVSITVTINNNRDALKSLGWNILGPKSSGNGWALVRLREIQTSG